MNKYRGDKYGKQTVAYRKKVKARLENGRRQRINELLKAQKEAVEKRKQDELIAAEEKTNKAADIVEQVELVDPIE
jgi:hypothetical protein